MGTGRKVDMEKEAETRQRPSGLPSRLYYVPVTGTGLVHRRGMEEDCCSL